MNEQKENKNSDILTVLFIVIISVFGFILKFIFKGIVNKRAWSNSLALISVSHFFLVVCLILSKGNLFVRFLLFLMPYQWVQHFVLWYNYNIAPVYQILVGFVGPIFIYFFCYGIFDWIRLRKYQTAFEQMGLKTANGAIPKVIEVYSGDRHQQKILVNGAGFDIEEFKRKKGVIESSLNVIVQEIRVSNVNRQIFEIQTAQKELVNFIRFEDYEDYLKKPYTFIVGESLDGIIVGDLCDVHHVIIAGATGGGKSVFFKQMLVGLLKSSKRIQLYLIDLKRGVEMKTFESLSNVKILKETPDAIVFLQSVVEEMEKRFLYLEKNGFTEILPERDKLDRIVIGIDEASVLYTIERYSKLSKENAEMARELTDKIAKLGRAAGINLILATQKVVKETIDTRVQTNINARMVFRLNTIASSMIVLGNKKAAELPLIKGRAIWSVGSQDITVQVPLLNNEEMIDEINLLQSKFNSETHINFGPMIKEIKLATKSKGGFKKAIEESELVQEAESEK